MPDQQAARRGGRRQPNRLPAKLLQSNASELGAHRRLGVPTRVVVPLEPRTLERNLRPEIERGALEIVIVQDDLLSSQSMAEHGRGHAGPAHQPALIADGELIEIRGGLKPPGVVHQHHHILFAGLLEPRDPLLGE
jgi:hypothetical protein